MPNQTKKDKEKIILNYIIEYPTHGPRRIANELNQQEIKISETGVYNVLRRKQLNHRLDRLSSLVELQDDLDKFIYHYNFKRTNQGYRLKGKVPYQKFLDDRRKYTLPEPK